MSDPTDPAAAEGAPPPRPRGTLRIGSIAGIDVLITSSWFIVALLISLGFAPRIEEEQPGLGFWKYVAGFVFAVVLYLSVLLHEASHAVMAQRLGYGVNSITLHFLGGMTEIDGASRKPRHEFWIAVVGPLTSIAVGWSPRPAWFVVPDGLVRVASGPGRSQPGDRRAQPRARPPLDGGRVLKAIVWGASGNQHRARWSPAGAGG